MISKPVFIYLDLSANNIWKKVEEDDIWLKTNLGSWAGNNDYNNLTCYNGWIGND